MTALKEGGGLECPSPPSSQAASPRSSMTGAWEANGSRAAKASGSSDRAVAGPLPPNRLTQKGSCRLPKISHLAGHARPAKPPTLLKPAPSIRAGRRLPTYGSKMDPQPTTTQKKGGNSDESLPTCGTSGMQLRQARPAIPFAARWPAQDPSLLTA